ncbi:BTB/POZ and MATH domain-containing protein 4-like [Polistes fuscatus]|uniref:BTB/POZ and MATH domain-containing protein 4-like n=1 Tax=Polistes fuscatus TaxID=30207 RepID=UPI001CA88247|nr:BTB/POZ and MATH domain-containing protein 4-like [Polistes fuscatus]
MEEGNNQYIQSEFKTQIQTNEYRWNITDFQRGSVKKSPIFILSSLTYSITLLFRGNDLVIFFSFRRNPYGGYLSVRMNLLDFNDTYFIDKNHREIVYPNVNDIADRFDVLFQVTHIYPLTKKLFSIAVRKREEISKYISSLCLNIEFSDVIITLKDSIFPAHKIILASQSTVFKNICNSRVNEVPLKINITDCEIEKDIFVIMLRYIYTNKIKITDNTDIINKTIAVAASYKVNNLIKLCEHILIERMSVETVFNSLLIADKFNFPELENYCFEFISKNKKIIRSRKEYENLKQNSRIVSKLMNYMLT